MIRKGYFLRLARTKKDNSCKKYYGCKWTSHQYNIMKSFCNLWKYIFVKILTSFIGLLIVICLNRRESTIVSMTQSVGLTSYNIGRIKNTQNWKKTVFLRWS